MMMMLMLGGFVRSGLRVDDEDDDDDYGNDDDDVMRVCKEWSES